MFPRDDTTERFMIEAVGRDDNAIRIGLRWLLRWAAEHGQTAAISVYALDNLRRLENVLGTAAIKTLAAGDTYRTGNATIELITQRRNPGRFAGPVLAIWTNDKRLRDLDELGTAAICAIPFTEGAIDEWKAAWGPTDLRSGGEATRATISNPVVEAALRSLSAAVNLSTGLAHPDDRAAAVDLFRILMSAGERYNPTEIRAWAARNGWGTSDADELATVASAIADGKRLRGASHWTSDALSHWRAEAVEDPGVA